MVHGHPRPRCEDADEIARVGRANSHDDTVSLGPPNAAQRVDRIGKRELLAEKAGDDRN